MLYFKHNLAISKTPFYFLYISFSTSVFRDNPIMLPCCDLQIPRLITGPLLDHQRPLILQTHFSPLQTCLLSNFSETQFRWHLLETNMRKYFKWRISFFDPSSSVLQDSNVHRTNVLIEIHFLSKMRGDSVSSWSQCL